MEQLKIILSLAGTAIGLLVTAVTFIAKFFKSAKAKKIAEHTLEICNAVLPYIEQAESFINYSGTEKKEFVMTKANQFAIEQGIEFDAELVNAKVEELVQLTKEVNSAKKESKSNEKIVLGSGKKRL